MTEGVGVGDTEHLAGEHTVTSGQPTVNRRVFAISDLHVDYDENLQWLETLCAADHRQDYLILAGDITDDLLLLGRVFDLLRATFHRVLFVPGNHELWLRDDDHDCSLSKFHAVLDLCARHGVVTESLHDGGLSLVPLFSWYDHSFGVPDRHLRRAWRDYRACRWPTALNSPAAINDHFLAFNEAALQIRNQTVISYSHFLPRIDVMPRGIPEKRRRVYPVLGSEGLGRQVARLAPDLHVYGHSHVNRTVHLQGITFVNNAFGYPTESNIARKQLVCVHGGREPLTCPA
ncbi:MAG: hypothetical protein RLZZ385_243 [Pseudomonadota bacterium]|jgi:Icc-related predicted phosphoesterase